MKALNIKSISGFAGALLFLSAGSLSAQSLGNQYYDSPGGNPKGRVDLHVPDPVDIRPVKKTIVVTEKELQEKVRKVVRLEAVFEVEEEGTTVARTDADLQNRVIRMENRLAAFGIKKSDVNLEFVSLIPVYEVIEQQNSHSRWTDKVQKGYRMHQTLRVVFNDRKHLDRIIAEAERNGITALTRVEYTYEYQ